MYSHKSKALRPIHCAAILLLVIGSSKAANCQSITNPDLWKWTKHADHLDSVVQVSMNGSKATGVIVRVNRDRPKESGFECLVLTANHVVEPDKGIHPIKVTHRDGSET